MPLEAFEGAETLLADVSWLVELSFDVECFANLLQFLGHDIFPDGEYFP